MFTYSRKLIVFNKLQLVLGMGGSDGHRNDTLLIVMEKYICMGDIEPPSRSQVVGTVGPLNWSPVYVNYYRAC